MCAASPHLQRLPSDKYYFRIPRSTNTENLAPSRLAVSLNGDPQNPQTRHSRHSRHSGANLTVPQESSSPIDDPSSHGTLCMSLRRSSRGQTATPMSDLPADENIDMHLHEGGRPAEPFRWHISHATKRLLFSGYTNVLLVFVPIGIAAGTFGWPAEAVFVLNFLAIIPLAPLITFSIDKLSPNVGHAFGGLMKPTSGNMVEMIVSCLSKCVV
jgi:hypothetical protein